MILQIALLFLQLMTTGAGGNGVSVAAVTPAIISVNGAPSTQTNALGTKANNTCSTNAYCTQTVDATASGDTIIVYYTYKSSNTTAHAPTITDDKGGGSSTYTCVTEANDGANPRNFAGMCYSINVAANINKITASYGAAVTQAAVGVVVAYNIASFDVTSANGTTVAATTWTPGAMTTTANSDLVISYAVDINTRTNVSAFTAGSGFTLQLADRRDAQAVQSQVQSSAGSITASLTGQSDGYVAVAAAFKSGTSGSVPAGIYIAHLYHYNEASAQAAGTINLQVPTSGNLLAITVQGGGTNTQLLTGITDGSSNTYTQCGVNTLPTDGAGNHPGSQTFYAANLTNGLLAVALTTTGIGDVGPVMFYDIAGAATSQTCAHRGIGGKQAGTGSSLTVVTGLAPGSSNGLTVSSLGVDFNTMTALSAPTGTIFDLNTNGGMNLSGPWPVDENNGAGHAYNTDNTIQTWTYTLTDSTTAVSNWTAEISSFQASGATVRPSFWTSTSCTTIASNSVTCPSIKIPASALIWVDFYWNQTGDTIQCGDPTNGATAYTANTATTGTGVLSGFRLQSFYFLSAAAGTYATKCQRNTGAGTITTAGLVVHVAQGVTALDKTTTPSAGSSATVTSATTATTTAADEYLTGGCVVGNAISGANGSWILRESANFGSNGSADQVVKATGTYQLSLAQSGGASNFICNLDTFK